MSRDEAAVASGRGMRERRLQLGWTQQQLAAAAGVSRSAVAKAESGELPRDGRAATSITRALDAATVTVAAATADQPRWQGVWAAHLAGGLILGGTP